jgi:hypothetical protein
LKAEPSFTVTMVPDHDDFVGNVTWNRRHNIVYFCDFCVNCEHNKQNCGKPIGTTWADHD